MVCRHVPWRRTDTKAHSHVYTGLLKETLQLWFRFKMKQGSLFTVIQSCFVNLLIFPLCMCALGSTENYILTSV